MHLNSSFEICRLFQGLVWNMEQKPAKNLKMDAQMSVSWLISIVELKSNILSFGKNYLYYDVFETLLLLLLTNLQVHFKIKMTGQAKLD